MATSRRYGKKRVSKKGRKSRKVGRKVGRKSRRSTGGTDDKGNPDYEYKRITNESLISFNKKYILFDRIPNVEIIIEDYAIFLYFTHFKPLNSPLFNMANPKPYANQDDIIKKLENLFEKTNTKNQLANDDLLSYLKFPPYTNIYRSNYKYYYSIKFDFYPEKNMDSDQIQITTNFFCIDSENKQNPISHTRSNFLVKNSQDLFNKQKDLIETSILEKISK